jgi:HlyD family secretion protein
LAEGRRDASKAQLDELLAGTRPEDIDQARANYAAAQATLADAQATFARQKDLAARNVSSQQQLDDARMALDSATARLGQTHAAMVEAINGPRVQDIDASKANLRAAEATLELSRTELARTRLIAPSAGTVMTRVIEPGTVVLPAAAVYSIAIDGEVWVRAFAPEPLLARLAPNAAVTLSTDAGRSYRGHIGYVSPAAEFTPKTVETPELRTQLVYRLRIRVEDPDDGVRQGMPVTIHLATSK